MVRDCTICWVIFLEWFFDWYGKKYPIGFAVDPVGTSGAETRVYRGGSWYSGARGVRAAGRGRIFAGHSESGLGFRLSGRTSRSSLPLFFLIFE